MSFSFGLHRLTLVFYAQAVATVIYVAVNVVCLGRWFSFFLVRQVVYLCCMYAGYVLSFGCRGAVYYFLENKSRKNLPEDNNYKNLPDFVSCDSTCAAFLICLVVLHHVTCQLLIC